MTPVSPIVKPVSQMRLAPGSAVIIPNVSWAEFESILQELGEKRSSRVAYSKGLLEIMVPLPEHEIPRDLISDIVKILLKIKGIRYQPFGSTTFKSEGAAGVEPDACFYIQNYQRMIGHRRLEPDDPPPDLAIETDVTAEGSAACGLLSHSSPFGTSKTTLDAYAAIAVPEVWIYDRSTLTIYLLENRQYSKSDTSPTFPDVLLTHIIPTVVERAWQVGSVQALEELEKILE